MELSGNVSKSSRRSLTSSSAKSGMAVSSDDRSIDMGIRNGALVQDSIEPINDHSSGALHERGHDRGFNIELCLAV
jgi:hypothetical protein